MSLASIFSFRSAQKVRTTKGPELKNIKREYDAKQDELFDTKHQANEEYSKKTSKIDHKHQSSMERANKKLAEKEKAFQLQQRLLSERFEYIQQLMTAKHKELMTIKDTIQEIESKEVGQLKTEDKLRQKEKKLYRIERQFAKDTTKVLKTRKQLETEKQDVMNQIQKFDAISNEMQRMSVNQFINIKNNDLRTIEKQLDSIQVSGYDSRKYGSDYIYIRNSAMISNDESTSNHDKYSEYHRNYNNNVYQSDNSDENDDSESSSESETRINRRIAAQKDREKREIRRRSIRRQNKSKRTRKNKSKNETKSKQQKRSPKTSQTRGRKRNSSVYKRRSEITRSMSPERNRYTVTRMRSKRKKSIKSKLTIQVTRKVERFYDNSSRNARNSRKYSKHRVVRNQTRSQTPVRRKSRYSYSDESETDSYENENCELDGTLHVRLIRGEKLRNGRGYRTDVCVSMQIEHCKQIECSSVKVSKNPVFDEIFALKVKNYETENLIVRVVDDRHDRTMAKIRIPVKDFVKRKMLADSVFTMKGDMKLHMQLSFQLGSEDDQGKKQFIKMIRHSLMHD